MLTLVDVDDDDEGGVGVAEPVAVPDPLDERATPDGAGDSGGGGTELDGVGTAGGGAVPPDELTAAGRIRK